MAKTIRDLGKKFRRKYPGEYDDYTDEQLGKMLKEDYPGDYDEYTDVPVVSKKKQKPIKRGFLGSLFYGLDKAANVASEPATRSVYAPLAKQAVGGDPGKMAALEEVSSKEGVVPYPSDVAEIMAEGTPLEPLFSDTKIPFHTPMGKVDVPIDVVTRIATDIGLDPLTYVGIGTPTKLGRLNQILRSATREGKKIKLKSKAARMAGELHGGGKASPLAIQKAKKAAGKEPIRFSEAVGRKEASLLTLAGKEVIGGKLGEKLLQPLDKIAKARITTKINGLVANALSTKSGNPEFDKLMSEMNSVAYHKAGVEIQEGLVIEQKMQYLTRKLGIPRKELNRQITALVEKAKPTSKKLTQAKYGPKAIAALDVAFNDALIDAKVALVNARKQAGIQGAMAAHNTGQAPPIILQLEEKVADLQGELNKLRGVYTPPRGIDPEVEDLVRHIRDREANRLLQEQNSGVRLLPQLSDAEYIAHVTTPGARDARIAKLKGEGKFPGKFTQNELSEFLANSIKRQFMEVKPIVVDAWRKTGYIDGRTARALKGKNGVDVAEKLLELGRINEGQYTDLVHVMTVDEVNELGKQGKLKHIFGDYKGEIFHTDPVFSSSIRGVRGAEAMSSAEMMREMIKRGLALPEQVKPSNWIKVKDSKHLEALKDLWVSPEIARVLNKWDSFVTHPDEYRKLLRAYDVFHSLSKAWALAVFPAYHSMNMVGNFWNNWLAGLTNPDLYLQAQAALMRQSKYKTINKMGNVIGWRRNEFTDTFGEVWDTKKLVDEANRLGVLHHGFYARDVGRTVEEEVRLLKDKWYDPRGYITPSRRNRFLRAGFAVGRQVEDNARLAHFIDRLKKGDTAEQAAMSVKKFLFDYSDLTNFERNYLNRIFFFYTWTRKNIPLQLHSLVTSPGKFTIPFKAKHEIEKEVPVAPEKYLPEWMKDNFPIRVKYDKKTGEYEYFMLNRWLPAGDLVKLAHLHEVALGMLAPIPRAALEYTMNQDTFLHRKIYGKEGLLANVIGGENAQKAYFNLLGTGRKAYPSTWVHGFKTIRLLNEIDKLSDEDRDLYSKMLSLLTGKTYRLHPRDMVLQNSYKVGEDMEALQTQLNRAVREKDSRETKRIIKQMKKKGKEY